MNKEEIIVFFKKNGNKKNVLGMKRFGINTETACGVSMPEIRKLAKKIKKNHELAMELWKTKIHEARILATIIADPAKITEAEMDMMVNDFNSWDVCDQACGNLLDKTDLIYKKIDEWAKSEKEFVRRTAFSCLAWIAVHDKKLEDKDFDKYFILIKKYVLDERNFVKKAVNWALRQIGKRNFNLNKKAILEAQEILKNNPNSKSAKWIANGALRELKNEKTISIINRRNLIK